MAITKTRTVQRLEVYPAVGDQDEVVHVVYNHIFDDSSDDELPVTHTHAKVLKKTTTTLNDDGEDVVSNTDVSGEDQLVQDVCAAVWA